MLPNWHHPLIFQGAPFPAPPHTSQSSITWYPPQGLHTFGVDSPGGHPWLVNQYWWKNHPRGVTPPPSMLVAQRMACLILLSITVMWKYLSIPSSSSSSLADLPSLSAPSASAPPTRPACWPLFQRSFQRLILSYISLARSMPNVLVSITWAKTRGLSELQLRLRTPLHSSASRSINRWPNTPWGVEYQLADCAAIKHQWRCHTASSRTPLSRCAMLLLCGWSPKTPANNRCALEGVNSSRSTPSSWYYV